MGGEGRVMRGAGAGGGQGACQRREREKRLRRVCVGGVEAREV